LAGLLFKQIGLRIDGRRISDMTSDFQDGGGRTLLHQQFTK